MMLYEEYLIKEVLPIYVKTDMAILEGHIVEYLSEVKEISEEEAQIFNEMIDDAVASSKKQIEESYKKSMAKEQEDVGFRKSLDAAEKLAKRGTYLKRTKAPGMMSLKPKATGVWGSVKGAASRSKDFVAKHATTAGKFVGKHKVGAGIAAGVATAAAAALIYKRYMSKAAKACSSASDRNACLAAYKAKASKLAGQ